MSFQKKKKKLKKKKYMSNRRVLELRAASRNI